MSFLKDKLYNFYPLYTLWKKEIKSSLISPLTPFLFIAMLVGSSMSLLANSYWLGNGVSDFKNYFLSIPILLAIIIPVLTMNIWAEEKKQQTHMILFSMPLSERHIVYAKYFSQLTIWFFMSFLPLIPPLSLLELVYLQPLSFFLSYVSIFIFGCTLISISQAISFSSKYIAINFLFSFVLIIILNIIHIPIALFYKWEKLQNILLYLSFYHHFENASKGIFDSRDMFYYIVLLIFGIELNIAIIRREKK